jgi:hypothetical protein
METQRQWETAKGLMPSPCTISSLRGRRCTISSLRESHAISLHHLLLCEACERREHASGRARHAATSGQIIVCARGARQRWSFCGCTSGALTPVRPPTACGLRAVICPRTGVALQSSR